MKATPAVTRKPEPFTLCCRVDNFGPKVIGSRIVVFCRRSRWAKSPSCSPPSFATAGRRATPSRPRNSPPIQKLSTPSRPRALMSPPPSSPLSPPVVPRSEPISYSASPSATPRKRPLSSGIITLSTARAALTPHILKRPFDLVGIIRIDLDESVNNEWRCG